jgi:predicted metal-binding membrane protein
LARHRGRGRIGNSARPVLPGLLLGFGVMVAAAGTMNVAWMVLITLVVFAEKMLPHGPSISAVVALGLIALGLLVGGGAVQLGG